MDWYSEQVATFGDRLAGARESAGMKQKELARNLGVKKDVIVAWENDAKEPRANRLPILAGLLGVSLSWLLTGRGQGPDGPSDAIAPGATIESPDDLLSEIRHLRNVMLDAAERLADLERRVMSSPRTNTDD